jgi:hypothetical protein
MTPSRRFLPHLERLEGRDVPAVVIVNPTTATYTDVDGDHVTIKVSIGTLTANLFTTLATGKGDQLQEIDFSEGGFDGTSLTVSVAKVAGGDGRANIGFINSSGHDLGTVVVKGDLGRIDVGSGSQTVPAAQSLTVNSLGRVGTDTQAVGGTLENVFIGDLGALVVAGDVKDAFVFDDGSIGAITIGGSLIGGTADHNGEVISTSDIGLVKVGHDVQGGAGSPSGSVISQGKLAGVTIGGALLGGSNDETGEISSNSDMGLVKIGHDVQGGSGGSSGFVNSNGNLAGVAIGGSLIGGSGDDSGEIFSQSDMGVIKIGHDVLGASGNLSGSINTQGELSGVSIGGSLIGGSNTNTGEVFASSDVGLVTVTHDVLGGSGPGSGFIGTSGKLSGVTIGGSLVGGTGSQSGEVFSAGDVGAVKISHNLIGGSNIGSTSLDSSGIIKSLGQIASVTIGGSVVSGNIGINGSSGTLTNDATIRAGNDIGSLTVKGCLIGNVTEFGAFPVVISARGQAVQGTTTDLAIGSISIGGRVEFADILAGYDTNLNPVNGDAQIGAVTVGGDWAGSNLVAGAMNAASGNTKFGDANDASIGAGTLGIIGSITSITVKGLVFGTPDGVSNTDHFGFVAQVVGSVKVNGNAFALTSGPDDDNLSVGETGDVTIHEI